MIRSGVVLGRRCRVSLGWPMGLALALSGCAGAPRFLGPLPVRDQHPAQLTVLHLDPRGVAALPSGAVEARWNSAYTSLFLSGQDFQSSFEMDGELLRTALALRVGVSDTVEVGFELPFAHTTGGFLDDFVVAWHDTFGFPNRGRDQAPRDRFGVTATYRGQTVYQVEQRSFELLDLPFWGQWALLPLSDRAVTGGLALRTGIELPTGDQDAGYGNGELDLAIGLVGELRYHWISLTGHAQHSFAGSPRSARRAGLDFGDVTSLGLGLELACGADTQLLVQTEWETSTLRGLGLDRAADDQWLFWAGLRTALSGRSSVEIGFGEDLSRFVAPDFTAWVGFRFDI